MTPEQALQALHTLVAEVSVDARVPAVYRDEARALLQELVWE